MIIEDDGLIIPEVGPWAKEKYSLVQTSCNIFTTAMKPPKWYSLVYIDLFAGAGFAKIRDTSEIVTTSALRSIDIRFRFNRYIFCDIENENIMALKKRVARLFHDTDARYISGDVNDAVPDIISNMPVADRDHKVLSFCFIDPFKLEDLAFETITQLTKRFMDFLVLVPTDMDANRNVSTYIAPENVTIARFTGRPDWRTRWDAISNKSFGIFVLEEFSSHMQKLNYKITESVLIRNYQKNAPLYRLTYFSTHDLGRKFWKETKKSSIQQMNLLE